ncbi:efflux transporter outer membrane subunit [Pseudoduganella sp. FT93W]|uniref:Efflux transporter outer membrane subunit n=1 Tax=Duganella fentianensis TaxID=2692177 RepID=A0A845I6L6_9BURK|nr:efflux transporter outer membrane subunit [Duganella fentianensis]MYN47746.1 efflux transporter outer membrane subunit [Duganella fentianensis]
MSSKPVLIALLVTSLTTGCAVGPDYSRPASTLPQQFNAQAAIEARPASAVADLASWWHGFGDPQLSRLIDLALAQNLELAAATARITQARAGVAAAQAAILPSASLSGQAARARQSLETPQGQILNSVPGYDRYGDAYEVNLGASWEIDLFGGLRRSREAALAEYQASAAGAVATRLAVAAQTADLYISLRGLQNRLQIAAQQIQTQQDLLASVRLLHGKGLAPEIQLKQAEAALALAQATLPTLEEAYEVALNALDVMLGALPGTYRRELLAGGSIPQAPQIQSLATPGELLRRRPDLIVAERRLAAAHARIGGAIAEYYPKLSLNGLLGSASAISAGNLFNSGANQASAALGLRWRLFDFKRIDAQIAQAEGLHAESLIAYRQAILKATEDVENAYTAVLKRESQSAQLNQGWQSLGSARNATFAAYQKGLVSKMDVLRADESLLRVADAKAQAEIDAARAAVATFRALGGGWQVSQTELALR